MYVYMYMYVYIYIYIYMYMCTMCIEIYVHMGIHTYMSLAASRRSAVDATATGTKILDLRGFDSNIILIARGGIVMSVENRLDSLTRAILVQ